jgi:phosphohistidine phosphatase SixA
MLLKSHFQAKPAGRAYLERSRIAGVNSSKIAANELKKAGVKYDVILSSSQLRTTETALFQFPGQKVYQVCCCASCILASY